MARRMAPFFQPKAFFITKERSHIYSSMDFEYFTRKRCPRMISHAFVDIPKKPETHIQKQLQDRRIQLPLPRRQYSRHRWCLPWPCRQLQNLKPCPALPHEQTYGQRYCENETHSCGNYIGTETGYSNKVPFPKESQSWASPRAHPTERLKTIRSSAFLPFFLLLCCVPSGYGRGTLCTFLAALLSFFFFPTTIWHLFNHDAQEAQCLPADRPG